MSEKTEAEPTLAKPVTVVKAEHLGNISPRGLSKRSTKKNLLATLPETIPVLLAMLDAAAEKGLTVQKHNVCIEGHETACIVFPGRVWEKAGKYVRLEER